MKSKAIKSIEILYMDDLTNSITASGDECTDGVESIELDNNFIRVPLKSGKEWIIPYQNIREATINRDL